MEVIILAGGFGSRLDEITKIIPKPLVKIGGTPIIEHIIKSFVRSNNLSFIIALGYKGNLIKDYLEIAYPNRKFIFIEINPYMGKGSGLGYTLKCCKKYIKEDFYFHTNDSIIMCGGEEEIDAWRC